ncbi:MAG: adenosylmethionine decarboxylase [Candidatus Omnitrophota bacterium]
MQSLGNHLIIELYDCHQELIDNAQGVEQALLKAVRISGAKMVQSVIHQFNPHGISGVIVIEESHFSVHTWPEYGYCALDIFTCGDEIDYYSALQCLKDEFQAKNLSVTEMKRGLLNLPVKLLHKPFSGEEKRK